MNTPIFACPIIMDRFGTMYAFGDSNYSFSQQEKDFIKLQFKYGLALKRRLDAGTLEGENIDGTIIPAAQSPTADQQMAYYNDHLWLAKQSLSNVDDAYWTEFAQAIHDEDLQWLANQVGEDVASVSSYVGKAAGTAVAGITSGIAQGVEQATVATAKGLSLPGWLLLGGLGVAAYFLFVKSGPLRKYLPL